MRTNELAPENKGLPIGIDTKTTLWHIDMDNQLL